MRVVIDTNLLVSSVISAGLTPEAIVDDMRALATVVSPALTPRVVLTDPADFVASGDKHDLLPLGGYEGIPIVTAREAVERLNTIG